ncbi:ABC transporter permease, partial [Streptomyces litchfieldiae]
VTDVRDVETETTMPGGESVDVTLSVTQASYEQDFTSDVLEGDFGDAFQPDSISVGLGDAEEFGIGIGDQLTVAFEDGETAELTVRAILNDDSAVGNGTWYISEETAREYVSAEVLPLPFMMFASAADGQEDAARAALDAAMEPYPQMEVRDQAEFKDLIQSQIGQLLNMVYGLLALAIIVAILGVVNTLALSVVERTREIGLMRAIGLSRRQLRRMIRLESVVIALFGALLGLGLGMAWGAAGHQLLAMEGMKVLEIPWPTVISVFIGSAVVGLLAALLPAFRAGRMNVLNAIATD